MQAPFFLVVEGERGPKRPHASYERALAEAERLRTKDAGDRRIFVLGTIATLEPPKTPSAVDA